MLALRVLRWPVSRLALVTFLLLVLVSSPRPALAANGVVGSGTPGSCNDTAFDTAFYAVQSSGGGIITFNCGAAPHTIVFSTQKTVSTNTELRGAGLISLSGANATPLFQVYSAQTLTLDRIVLTRAYGPAGAIENFGKLVIKNSQFTNNASTTSGGAITSYGELNISGSTLSGNSAAQTGGAIFADGGTVTISASTFDGNTAAGAGGAVRGPPQPAARSTGPSSRAIRLPTPSRKAEQFGLKEM